MMEIIVYILMMYIFFKIVGFVFHILGKTLGLIFGIIGYLFLGVMSVALFGMAIVFLPIILVLGIAGIAALFTNPI